MPSTSGYLEAIARAEQAARTAEPAFGTFFLAKFLDLRISYDDEQQTCTVVLPYAPYLCNPQGSMHGGVITTAMDISMGHLCHRFLSTAITIEMQQRFLRPLTGPGRCEARLLKPGRNIVHLESLMYDDTDRPVASCTGSWYRLDAQAAPR
jgi:uncharacterized protein (TIGR00369 family)